MTTLAAALDALEAVARANFLAMQGDLTYGVLYRDMIWHLGWPWDQGVDHTFPTVFVYDNSGVATNRGLGSAKANRYPRVRVEAFANKYADAMQVMEQIRAAWIADFDYLNGSGVAGQGYLRAQGLKHLEIGEHFAADWGKRNIIFRRIADVTIEIGD